MCNYNRDGKLNQNQTKLKVFSALNDQQKLFYLNMLQRHGWLTYKLRNAQDEHFTGNSNFSLQIWQHWNGQLPLLSSGGDGWYPLYWSWSLDTWVIIELASIFLTVLGSRVRLWSLTSARFETDGRKLVKTLPAVNEATIDLWIS